MFFLGGISSVYTHTHETLNFPGDKSEEEKCKQNVFDLQFSCLKNMLALIFFRPV